jgi:hypothetical protein
MLHFWILIVGIGLGGAAHARTLWSGSFVQASVPEPVVRVGINYPARGTGKICGIEFKSHTMILHRRVWQAVADGLLVEVSFEDNWVELLPYTEQHEGARLSYLLPERAAAYANLRIAVRSGQALNAYFAAKLNPPSGNETMMIVARECN